MFKRDLIEVLKKVINNLEDDLMKEKEKNKELQNNLAIILENESENRKTIKELTDNLKEYKNLINKSAEQYKELLNKSKKLAPKD